MIDHAEEEAGKKNEQLPPLSCPKATVGHEMREEEGRSC